MWSWMKTKIAALTITPIFVSILQTTNTQESWIIPTPTANVRYGCMGPGISSILARQIGVILHQPLNLSIFRKNTKNSQNMNGIPVCLGQKTENAPTWRSPSPLFWGLFLAYFAANFHPNYCFYYRGLLKLKCKPRSQLIFYAIPYYHPIYFPFSHPYTKD